jgi:hypothetical protein
MNYLQEFDNNKLYQHHLVDKFNNKNIILAPIGGLSEYCHQDFIKKKRIFLDEPHRLILDNWHQDKLQYVYAYKKALKVCKILSDFGFEIVTFCSTKHDNYKIIADSYKFLNIINGDGWIPYFKLLSFYKFSLFFNPYQESHGYSVYENLQMGNSIITFTENFNILTSKQFQNGVVLSLYFSDDLCVSMIKEYYEKYINAERSELIAAEANKLYSADTFVSRIKRGLGIPQLLVL